MGRFSILEPDARDLQMFVIKNLDTGLEMRIDDFDKLANIATAERQVGLLIYGQSFIWAMLRVGAMLAGTGACSKEGRYQLQGYQGYQTLVSLRYLRQMQSAACVQDTVGCLMCEQLESVGCLPCTVVYLQRMIVSDMSHGCAGRQPPPRRPQQQPRKLSVASRMLHMI